MCRHKICRHRYLFIVTIGFSAAISVKRTLSAPSSPSFAARISSISSATWAALNGWGATPNPSASAARSATCPSYEARKVDMLRNPPPKEEVVVVAAAILKPDPRKVVTGDGEVREEEKGEVVPARTEAERTEEAEVLLRTAEVAARREAVRRRREFISLLLVSFFSSGIELEASKMEDISGRQDATQRRQVGWQ